MVNFVVNFSNDTLYGDVQLCMQAYNCLYYTIICIVFVCVFFFTGIFYIFLFKRNRIHLVFSVDRKIPTRGSTVPVGNEAWNFPVDTEHQWLMPSQNIFEIGFSLIWTWSIRGKEAKWKILVKSNNFGSKLFLLFKLRKRIPTLDIFIKE